MITKKGTIVNISGPKTVKVEVVRYRAHPKYRKSYRITKNFLVHDESSRGSVGDQVLIVQGRKRSKDKSFEIKEILQSAPEKAGEKA